MKEFDDSLRTVEHIFPESIGGNITIRDVCKGCNDHLGSFVDSPMVNNGFIDDIRFRLKLPGKDGSIPNPFKNSVMASDPAQKVRVKTENGKIDGIEIVTSKKVTTDEEGNKRIELKVDRLHKHLIPEMIEKMRSRYAKRGQTLQKEWKFEEYHSDTTDLHQTLYFHGFDWQRGIMKIAYEVTYRQLGPKYLTNPIATNLRELLRIKYIAENDFQRYPVRGTISLASNKEFFPLFSDPDSLYAALMSVNDSLSCIVKIFNVFQGLVLVSEKFFRLVVIERHDHSYRYTQEDHYRNSLPRVYNEVFKYWQARRQITRHKPRRFPTKSMSACPFGGQAHLVLVSSVRDTMDELLSREA